MVVTEEVEEKQEKIRDPCYVPGTYTTVGYKVERHCSVPGGLPAVSSCMRRSRVCDRHEVSARRALVSTPLSRSTSIISWCQ